MKSLLTDSILGVHVNFNGTQVVKSKGFVLIEFLDGRKYKRKIYYKDFSNYPIEYIVWDNKKYSVNTVKEL